MISFLLLLGFLCQDCSGGRILMYLPVATRSHLSAWNALAQGLAEADHQVTLVTRYSSNEFSSAVDHIVVDSSALRAMELDYIKSLISGEAGPLTALVQLWIRSNDLIETHRLAMENPRFQDIIQDPTSQFDLVIASPFSNEAGVMLADYISAPLILFLPANAEQLLSLALGHPDNLAWSGAAAGSLIDRTNTMLAHMFYQFIMKPICFVEPQYALLKKHLPNYTLSEYSSLERNADFAFYFSSPHLNNAAPRLPNTANTAFLHCRQGAPPTGELQSWLQHIGEEEKIVYMSLGSLIQQEHLPPHIITMFEKVFKKLNLKVIWKRKGKITERMFVSDWVDQQDILAIDRVKVFISQVGLMSMQESIFHEKPILGIPLTFEQRMNGDLITKFNLGVVMDFKELTEASFTKALIHLLEDGKIETQNTIAMAKLIKDFRTTPLQDAVWWSEYIMRHGDTRPRVLQSDHRYLSLVQFYGLDIMMMLLVLVAFLILLLYILIKIMKLIPRSFHVMLVCSIYVAYYSFRVLQKEKASS